jgi:hypothetical protein
LVTLAVFQFVRHRRVRPFLVQLAVLVVLLLFLRYSFGFPRSIPESRGSESAMIVVLFTSMLVGMLAHWLFDWLQVPRRQREPFDVGPFLAPLLASPIVFLPLLASLQNANLDFAILDTPRFMVLLVAFENGFFWREYFENRRKRASA